MGVPTHSMGQVHLHEGQFVGTVTRGRHPRLMDISHSKSKNKHNKVCPFQMRWYRATKTSYQKKCFLENYLINRQMNYSQKWLLMVKLKW